MDTTDHAKQPQPTGVRPTGQHNATKKQKLVKKTLLTAGAVLLIAVAALAVLSLLSNRGNAAGTIQSDKYQAVFFTNGQVYFGKLTAVNDDYMRIKGVYYLQNKQKADGDTSPQSTSAQNASDVELIKLGNEIHGPDDEMVVNKDQVLFFENLKPAGTVSQTISNFQKNKQ